MKKQVALMVLVVFASVLTYPQGKRRKIPVLHWILSAIFWFAPGDTLPHRVVTAHSRRLKG